MGMLVLNRLMSLQRDRQRRRWQIRARCRRKPLPPNSPLTLGRLITSRGKRRGSPCQQDADGISRAGKTMRSSIPDLPELKEQIQARSVSTASVQSSTAQQPEGPKGQQSDLANMEPHIWLDLETEKLLEFCEEPSMKELYPDRKSELCARLATKMNDHFGRREGYVPLDRDKIKEKLERRERLAVEKGEQLKRLERLEVEKGERQGFLPNIFDRCDTKLTSLFSAGEGTSSGSVRPKRKKCPTPRDKESSIQYLVYHGFKRIELYKYVKALEDEAVLSTFVAVDDHTERMDYLQACADQIVRVPNAGGGVNV